VNTAYATSAGDPTPSCGINFGKGVWYSFTSLTSGLVTISTCGSDFDTVLQVYAGSCGALSDVACNDDSGPACATKQASVSFLATGGTRYLILAGGYGGATGNLRVMVAATLLPSNDRCSGAIAMTAGTLYGVNTANATSTGDPTPVCQANFGHGVWYSFTPPISGPVFISTCGSDFDTVVQVYTGACGSLTPLGCNDDGGPACASVAASVRFMGTAGTTYWILAGGYGGKSGNLGIISDVEPTLAITRQGTNVVVSWPTSANGFYLQWATNLSPPVSWTYAWPVQVLGSNYVATNAASGAASFYRLKK
jgi:hypothetical protein